MAKLRDLAAFKAAVALLRERGLESELAEVYTLCKAWSPVWTAADRQPRLANLQALHATGYPTASRDRSNPAA